ncbi:hypothetical protein ACFYW9_11745 [Streptomyces sp. NPDC002698]|uniref:hypothetical protein n=1 Tax=Streptomyces sp. NPDC002698 TaxID=3364660 RepID=UPI0036B04D39
MKRGKEPSTGRQVVIGTALLVSDIVVIVGLLFGYGFAGWSDDGSDAVEAQMFARRTTWCLAVGAVVTGGGLLALRWRIPSAVQIIVLGIGALKFHALAAPH